MASTLVLVSGMFLAAAADAPLTPTAFMWWFIGLSGLIAWTTVVRRSAGTIRNGPLGFYAHGAVAASALTITLEAGSPVLVRVILAASIAVFGATWLAVVHTSRSRMLAAGGSVALAAAWCVAVGSTEDPSSNLWRWMLAFVVAGGVWRRFPRSSNDRHSMWTWSGGVTTVAMFTVLTAARPSSTGSLDTWTWVMVHAGAAVPALVVFGWPDRLTVFVLLVVAASIVSRGVLSGSRRLTMVGVEALIGIGAALLFEGRSVTAVTAAIAGSAIVLIATETERLISSARDEHPAVWIQAAEWIGLLAVPTTTILAGLQSLTYVPVLATYGAGVLVWGIVTRVRRRVFVGALSILAAVVLAVATPIAAAAAVGMATAGGVGVTFVIGVSVIGVAILLERYHDKLGTTLSRMSDAMADWE